MKKLIIILVLLLCSCSNSKSYTYKLANTYEVNGRQGICIQDDFYYVSGSKTLSKYDKDFNLILENDNPFEGYDIEVNHIGDIDIYNNELYLGVEYFDDGIGKNIQVAIYDADTLKLKRVFPFNSETGQKECSGIAVDYDHNIVYMSSWIDDESSNYLYRYDLDTGEYLGKTLMNPSVKWIQGVAYYNNNLFVTCDDGDADKNEADNMYRLTLNNDVFDVSLERSFDDVIKQGEIEGLTFDTKNKQFLLLYNRGSIIINGMPTGYYDGYDREIHEVFVYNFK